MTPDPNASPGRLAVVGAGTMGAGIALTALYAGLEVVVYDVAPEVLARAERYIDEHLGRKGLTKRKPLVRLTGNWPDLAPAAWAIEAVTEDLALKRKIFADLDGLLPPPVPLATNTSTLAVTAIASAARAPERVAGMHFFNPAPVLLLVEVARGARTDDATVEALVGLARRLGKTPVVTRDTPGFIVNRAARPFYGEALRMLGEGVASHEDIDRVVRSAGFPMGPFQLMDLIGVDVNFAATKSMYEQTFGEPRYRPHPIQERMVQQGALGRKTGRGFYRYDVDAPARERAVAEPAQARGAVAWVAPGSFGAGMVERLGAAGFDVRGLGEGEPDLGLIVAGRGEGLVEWVRRFDDALRPDAPLLCQAVDVTLGEVATWMTRPERLVGVDTLFGGQAAAVEVVAGPGLRDGLRERVERFVRALSGEAVWITDSPGLILPRLVCMLINEAAFAVGEGVADAESIDLAMRLGVNYPRGPLEWGRAIGYRRALAALDHLRSEFGEERYRAAPLLRRWAREA